jgi:hypothetical protein
MAAHSRCIPAARKHAFVAVENTNGDESVHMATYEKNKTTVMLAITGLMECKARAEGGGPLSSF